MKPEHRPLFEPLTIKGVTLRNRIVLPPMASNRDLTQPEGVVWYRQFARGGVGLVIVEATRIHRFEDHFTADNLRPLVEAVHSEGAAIAIQMFMAPTEGRDTPTAMTREDIEAGIARFASAAAVCQAAGFDGVEPHGAHGFLLNQFFSPIRNQRTDDYGGNLINRMRMGLDVVRAIREEVGDGLLLFYRHTPVEENGYSIEDSVALAKELLIAGLDVLDVSPASDKSPADLAWPFKRELPIPVIAVNRMCDHERAVLTLREGRADLVAIGRGLIADPDWVRKTQDERFDEIIECTECNQGCFGNLSAGKPVECVQHEEE